MLLEQFRLSFSSYQNKILSGGIRLSLGSITICLFLSSCNSQESKNIKDVTYAENDTFRLDLSRGEAVILKLGECRYCHLINDVTRLAKLNPFH